MSADLFAEFGSGAGKQQRPSNAAPVQAHTTPSFSFFDDLGSSNSGTAAQQQPQAPTLQWGQTPPHVQAAVHAAEEDDDWGDFEGGSSAPSVAVKQEPPAYTSSSRAPQAFHSQGQPAVPVTQIPQSSWQPAPVYKAKKSYDSNVLFDAEDDAQDEDDFGDFEEPESSFASAPTAKSTPSSGIADLLGDLSIAQQDAPSTSLHHGSRKKEAIKSPVRKDQAGGFGAMSKPKTTNDASSKQDDTWDSFDDWEASIPTEPKAAPAAKPRQASSNLSGLLSPTFTEPRAGELPPTNVPPPGVLLSLLPGIFTEAQIKLFKPMLSQTLPMRNKLASDPGTITYLQAYLEVISVAARIIAGRKLRWKRDAHLSQGMRIGPASSRATSGMKLTGIDKSENMKEEREVADVVRAWKEQIGKLRHVVSAANQAKPGSLGRGVDLAENMPVRTLKQAEGGVPAPQPCMLCGLKRDERVAAENQSVEDSFGEWWIEQTSMHRGCRNFWNEHKDTLRQR